MGKNSRRRHVDKQRRAPERRRRHQSELPTDRTEPRRDEASDVPAIDAVSTACRQLEGVFGLVLRDGLWARGWQPDEVMRHIRREASTVPAHTGLLATAIAADAALHDRVGNDVHVSWRRQTAAADEASLRDAGREGSPAHPAAELPDAS